MYQPSPVESTEDQNQGTKFNHQGRLKNKWPKKQSYRDTERERGIKVKVRVLDSCHNQG